MNISNNKTTTKQRFSKVARHNRGKNRQISKLSYLTLALLTLSSSILFQGFSKTPSVGVAAQQIFRGFGRFLEEQETVILAEQNSINDSTQNSQSEEKSADAVTSEINLQKEQQTEQVNSQAQNVESEQSPPSQEDAAEQEQSAQENGSSKTQAVPQENVEVTQEGPKVKAEEIPQADPPKEEHNNSERVSLNDAEKDVSSSKPGVEQQTEQNKPEVQSFPTQETQPKSEQEQLKQEEEVRVTQETSEANIEEKPSTENVPNEVKQEEVTSADQSNSENQQNPSDQSAQQQSEVQPSSDQSSQPQDSQPQQPESQKTESSISSYNSEEKPLEDDKPQEEKKEDPQSESQPEQSNTQSNEGTQVDSSDIPNAEEPQVHSETQNVYVPEESSKPQPESNSESLDQSQQSESIKNQESTEQTVSISEQKPEDQTNQKNEEAPVDTVSSSPTDNKSNDQGSQTPENIVPVEEPKSYEEQTQTQQKDDSQVSKEENQDSSNPPSEEKKDADIPVHPTDSTYETPKETSPNDNSEASEVASNSTILTPSETERIQDIIDQAGDKEHPSNENDKHSESPLVSDNQQQAQPKEEKPVEEQKEEPASSTPDEQPVQEKPADQTAYGSSPDQVTASNQEDPKKHDDSKESGIELNIPKIEEVIHISQPRSLDDPLTLSMGWPFNKRDLQENGGLTLPIGQNLSYTKANVSKYIQIERYTQDYNKMLNQYIPQNQPRVTANIKTDKVIYKPGDVMYIEVYMFDAFNKTPFTSENRDYGYYAASYYYPSLYASMNILDPNDISIYSTSTSALNSTLSFTYEIPESSDEKSIGGEYKIVISGSNMADAVRVFRIREYEKQQLVVQAEFNQDAYQPGDNVTGVLSVRTQDGSQFQQIPTYSYIVNFGLEQPLTLRNQRFDAQGKSTFNFQIPQNVNQSQITVLFNVRYQSINVPYTRTLTIVQKQSIVVDIIPETYNYVYDVPNKVYFQAYANDQRENTVEVSDSRLITVNPQTNEEQTLVNNIGSINHGRGYFEFTPRRGQQFFFVGTHQGVNNSSPFRYPLNVSQQVDIEEWEINFSVVRKVLENSESLKVRFFTNNKLVPEDVYILGIYNKEKPLHLEQFSFTPNQSFEFEFASDLLNLTNGGVLRLALFRVLRPLIWYDRFESLTQGKQKINYTSPLANITNETSSSATANNTYSTRTYIEDPFFVYYSIPRGEFLFFKKPAGILNVTITTDKEVYMPGDLVNFEVKVQDDPAFNSSNGKPPINYVSVVATDNSVFSLLPSKQQPPSLPAMVLLEQEVYTVNFEFYYANQYLEHIYQPQLSSNASSNLTLETGASSDMNIDLLMGVQGWRYGFFFPQMIAEWNEAVLNQTYEDRYLLEKIFAYKFQSASIYPYYRTYNYPTEALSSAAGVGAATGAAAPVMGAAPPAPSTANTSAVIEAPQPAAGSTAQGQQEGGQELTLSEREQALWNFIKSYRQCKAVANTRYYANGQNLAFLSDIGTRFDLSDTLYYSTANATTSNGVVKGQFILSDLITQFRISADAFDSTGRLGYSQKLITSRKPFYIEFQVPTMIVQGDRLEIPIFVINSLNQSLSARLTIVDNSESVGVVLPNDNELETVPALSQTIYTNMTLEALNISNNSFVQVRATGSTSGGKQYKDALLKDFQIVSPGVPQVQQSGGLIGSEKGFATWVFILPSTAVNGTIEFSAEVYTESFAELLKALRRIISQPSVCTFCLGGNAFLRVLAIEAFDNSSSAQLSSSEIESARSQIVQDFEQIRSEQGNDGGFGSSRGSQSDVVSSALNLYTMGAIRNASKGGVDSKAIDNTVEYILKQRTENGVSFIRPPYYTDRPQYVFDAFLLYILTSVGYTNPEVINPILDNLSKVADTQTSQTVGTADAFFLGLLSATYYNLNMTQQAQKYADYLVTLQDPETGQIKQVVNFFSSQQNQVPSSSDTEATAMAAIAWENDFNRYSTNIAKAVDFLTKNSYIGYYFYPTWSSILSFRAILGYLREIRPVRGSGEFALYINGTEVGRKPFSSEDEEGSITFDTSNLVFQPGQSYNATLTIENFVPDNNTNATNFTSTYRFSVAYDDTNPPTSNNTYLRLKVERNNNTANESLAVYNISLTNTAQNESIGLTIMEFRPPSCYQMNFELFEQLRANGVIESYELQDSNSKVLLYFAGLNPGQTINFTIDLAKQFNGICQERPQGAYEYYNRQAAVWIV